MKLNEVNIGDSVKIHSVRADGGTGMLRVLTLGLTLGTELTVISKTGNAIEVLAYGTRLAISNDIAKNIIVV